MTAKFKTLRDADLSGKRVLLRADLNVPMHNGIVTDKSRIERLIPTFKYLQQAGAKTIILSHFGRPKKPDPEQSLLLLKKPLEEALGTEIAFAADCVGKAAQDVIQSLKNGEFALMENLRFHAEEEKNDANFSKALAELGDIFVNDAFSAAHRAHASTTGIAKYLPAYAGMLLEEELNALIYALEIPKRPLAVVVGGAKISTKIDLLSNLVTKADILILGGGMANTFLLAQNTGIGKSLAERDMVEKAKEIQNIANKNKCQILLPIDAAIATEFKIGAQHRISNLHDIQDPEMILDIGPSTVNAYAGALKECQTILWNGPMGAFEIPPFDTGTTQLAQAAARLTKDKKILTVAGGGDTVAALSHAGVKDDFSYISTAGGAFLEWLEGKELPGITALNQA